MGKKKSKRKVIPFKQDNRITYNTAKPNRQARRLGIVAVEPPKQEAPKRETKAAVLSRKVQQARQIPTEDSTAGHDLRRIYAVFERKTAGIGSKEDCST